MKGKDNGEEEGRRANFSLSLSLSLSLFHTKREVKRWESGKGPLPLPIGATKQPSNQEWSEDWFLSHILRTHILSRPSFRRRLRIPDMCSGSMGSYDRGRGGGGGGYLDPKKTQEDKIFIQSESYISPPHVAMPFFVANFVFNFKRDR